MSAKCFWCVCWADVVSSISVLCLLFILNHFSSVLPTPSCCTFGKKNDCIHTTYNWFSFRKIQTKEKRTMQSRSEASLTFNSRYCSIRPSVYKKSDTKALNSAKLSMTSSLSIDSKSFNSVLPYFCLLLFHFWRFQKNFILSCRDFRLEFRFICLVFLFFVHCLLTVLVLGSLSNSKKI